MTSRLAAASLCLVLLAACSDTPPRLRQRTAAEWVEELWSPEAPRVTDAIGALTELSVNAERAVVEALEARLRRPPPKPDAAPFTVVFDHRGAKRLGLPMPGHADAVALVKPVIDARILAMGFAPVSIKATTPGEIDVVGLAAHPRAEVLRTQAALCTRGALEVRVVAGDPAVPTPLALRPRVYDDAMPWAARVAEETARWKKAGRDESAYAPAVPRWRVAPRADAPETFVLVEEPSDDADLVDERVVASGEPTVTPTGVVLGVAVREGRRGTVERFCAKNTGLDMAVLLDGVVAAVAPVPASDGRVLRLPVGPAPSGADPTTFGRDLLVVLKTGRMPLPLRPTPISDRYDTDPLPDNPFSRVLALLGPKGHALIDRVSAGDFPAWAKSSAAWAREHSMPEAPKAPGEGGR